MGIIVEFEIAPASGENASYAPTVEESVTELQQQLAEPNSVIFDGDILGGASNNLRVNYVDLMQDDGNGEDDGPEWEECYDEETGKKFYYNNVLETSSWETPREVALERDAEQRAIVLAENRDPWEECEDDDGTKFWYNVVSGESAWFRPGEEPEPEEDWNPEVLPLSRGRLIVTVVKAEHVKGKDSTLKAYLKMRVGESKIGNKMQHKTKTTEKAVAGGVVSFHNEKCVFDIQDPTTLCDKDGRAKVYIELYDDNFLKDPVLCTASLDVTNFIQHPLFFGDEPRERKINIG